MFQGHKRLNFHIVHTALILLATPDSQTTSPPTPRLSWCTTWYWRRGKEHDGGLLCTCCGSILSTWFSIASNSLSFIYHTQDQRQLKFKPRIKLSHCSIKFPNTFKVISRLQALKECEEVKQMSITVGPCKFS